MMGACELCERCELCPRDSAKGRELANLLFSFHFIQLRSKASLES
jgi:hypothetical protein